MSAPGPAHFAGDRRSNGFHCRSSAIRCRSSPSLASFRWRARRANTIGITAKCFQEEHAVRISPANAKVGGGREGEERFMRVRLPVILMTVQTAFRQKEGGEDAFHRYKLLNESFPARLNRVYCVGKFGHSCARENCI